MSAAEQQLDGCPLPASVVARTLSIRSVVALFRSIATRLDVGVPVTLMTSPFTRAGRLLAIGRPKDGERLSKSIRASQLISSARRRAPRQAPDASDRAGRPSSTSRTLRANASVVNGF